MFKMHIVSIFKSTEMMPYSLLKILITLLDIGEIKIFIKYYNFANVFSSNFIAELSKYIDINNYLIKQIYNKQLFYSFVYSLGLIELKTLKTYIKTNLISVFI